MANFENSHANPQKRVDKIIKRYYPPFLIINSSYLLNINRQFNNGSSADVGHIYEGSVF